jgi:hypothetical protein
MELGLNCNFHCSVTLLGSNVPAHYSELFVEGDTSRFMCRDPYWGFKLSNIFHNLSPVARYTIQPVPASDV